MNDSKEIQGAVDDLLLEHGCYVPLELLLSEGRLTYADYEAWRGGGGYPLEDCLFGDPEKTHELLRKAGSYCAELGLEPQEIDYTAWGPGSRTNLQFSRDPARDRRFRSHYRKPSDGHPQLDMFLDATGMTLANGIAQALAGRSYEEARRLLDRLFDTEPGHSRIGGLERLVEAAEGLTVPPADPFVALRTLRDELHPLAHEVLGPDCRHFLVPLWRRLARALEGTRFDATEADVHSSYAASQAEDWAEVCTSVERENDWKLQPVLLRRHARACARLRQDTQILDDWFRICWQFPDLAPHIGQEAEPELRLSWQRFLELEPELPYHDFPSWLLIEQPGLAHHAPNPAEILSPWAPESYSMIFALAEMNPHSSVEPKLIQRRRQLKENNPLLFGHYLNRAGR